MAHYGKGTEKACGTKSGTLLRPKTKGTGVAKPPRARASRGKLPSGGKTEMGHKSKSGY